MINIIASFILINLNFNKILNKYTRNLLKDFIKFEFIFQYLNFINNYKSGIKFEYLLIISLELDLDLDL